MLFRGLTGEDAQTWREMNGEMRDRSPVAWRKIVGVTDKALDKSLFRVLEWGGMEVR